MGFLARFEDKLENAVEGAAGAVFKAPVEPAQIAKRAEKEMRRSKLVGTGRQYAPTLYNVLLAPEDDDRLCGFYPTMAAEIETFLIGCAEENGFDLVGRPLVRFIVDDSLNQSKFEVVAENVAEEILQQLRAEEMEFYGLSPETPSASTGYGVSRSVQNAGNPYAPAVEDFSQDAWQRDDYYEDDYEDDAFNEETYAYGASAPLLEDDPFGDELEPVSSYPVLVNKSTGEVFSLTKPRLSIGRGEQNDIVLRDSNVSREHAEIAQGTQGWYFRDLGSTNGSKLNRRPIGSALLHDGDILTLGTIILEFRIR